MGKKKCKHCHHIIRQNGMEAGGTDRSARYVWGTTMEHDPNDGHPWYCGSSPDPGKKHEPTS